MILIIFRLGYGEANVDVSPHLPSLICLYSLHRNCCKSLFYFALLSAFCPDFFLYSGTYSGLISFCSFKESSAVFTTPVKVRTVCDALEI